MKMFHEAPIQIFDEVQKITDGDYALVHLFDNPEYFDKFKKAVISGREVILDNSIFELGSAVSGELLASRVEELRPTWYIVPDALEDKDKTLNQFYDFIETYPDLPGKRVGVIQGKSDRELLECYYELAPFCDMIAISFDYSHWLETGSWDNRWRRLMDGRVRFIHKNAHQFHRYMPHHLLGASLPQEIRYYKGLSKAFPSLLYSIDTSNPVVHGFYGIKYSRNGLESKNTMKLCDLVNADVNNYQKESIHYNIAAFRRFWYE